MADSVCLPACHFRDADCGKGRRIYLRDAETGQIGLINGRKLDGEFLRRRGVEREHLHKLTRQVGADLIHISTNRPYLPELVSFFDKRRKRLLR